MNDSEISALLPLAAAAARPGWRCPELSRWVAYVGATLDAGERARLANHLADCDACLAQVGFLARASALGPTPAVPVQLLAAARNPGVHARLGRGLALRPLAVTLAGASAFALALLVVEPRLGRAPARETGPASGDAVRGAAAPADGQDARGSAAVTGAPRLLRPLAGEIVAAGRLELRWEGTPEALFYSVQLLRPNGDLLWEGRTDHTRLVVPADAGLVAGQPLFAWVVAHLPSGAVVRSPAVSFRLAADSARR